MRETIDLRLLTISVFKYEEDLLATSLVVTSCDVVGLLDIRIDEFSPVLGDGLDVVELQRVFVTVFDLKFWSRHVDIDPGFLPLLFELVDYFPKDHGPDP